MSVPAKGMRRQEGGEKVTGSTRFTADLELSGLLNVHLVLSYVPSGKIRGMDVSA
ncbi:MAG: nicotinate dehydrogenase large molybdopterin subunit, partial [Chloroflexi bacterium]